MSNSRHCLFSYLMMLTSSASCLGQPAAEQPAMAAAKKCQELLNTVEFVFSRTDVDMPAVLQPSPSKSQSPAKPIPAQETIVESTNNVIIFDGNRGRLESSHPIWHGQTGDLNKRSSISITQGNTSKNHNILSGKSGNNSSIGSIEKTGVLLSLKEEILLPFSLFCRPLDQQFCVISLSDVERTGRQEAVQGAVCDVYSSKGGGSSHYELWLDPKRDFVPARCRHVLDGKFALNIVVSYEIMPDVGWMPTSWQVTQYGHGALQSVFRTSTIRINSHRIGSRYPNEKFDIIFPPGSAVYDDRDGKMYGVLPNGDFQEMQGNGTLVGPTISQSGWWYRYRWMLVGCAVVFISAIGVAVRRRKHSN